MGVYKLQTGGMNFDTIPGEDRVCLKRPFMYSLIGDGHWAQIGWTMALFQKFA